MIVVGIDPGRTTGFAVWSATERRLKDVVSMKEFEAKDLVLSLKPDLVIVEDANQRRAFGRMDILQKKYGAAVREGAGAAKRESKSWIEFLTGKGVPFIAQGPKAGRTKITAKPFKLLTGWTGRTNVHSRDAALMVYGHNEAMVRGLLQYAKGGAK